MNTSSKQPRHLGVIGLGSMGMGAACSALRQGVKTWGCDTPVSYTHLTPPTILSRSIVAALRTFNKHIYYSTVDSTKIHGRNK